MAQIIREAIRNIYKKDKMGCMHEIQRIYDFWVVELKGLLSEYVYERRRGDTDEIS